jgi:phosphoglycolate phosphatase-like HAD superfamily hydrolase
MLVGDLAVLFDLDETLFDRTTSLVVFLTYQHGRFADRLGEVTFEVWRDRFLALDPRGYVHKSLVYLALLTEFSGDLTAVDELREVGRDATRENNPCFGYARGPCRLLPVHAGQLHPARRGSATAAPSLRWLWGVGSKRPASASDHAALHHM